MMKKVFLMTIALVCAVAQGAWAQQGASRLRPVSAADVKVTAVNDAYFTDEGIVVVSPDEAPKPALARRRVSGMDAEGGASLTGAKLYSYTYPSVDADGNVVTLSSLMAVPTKMLINGMAKPNNLIIGCHVTITSNYECPTEYNKTGGTLSWMTDIGMLIDYTRYDAVRQPCCLVILPDYEGYGVTKNRPHPYLYQELTARQVVDAVRYGLALYNENKGLFSFKDFEDDWKSVCVGYSQGGSVSLATHRFIEENGLADELHFAGSVCGDGPYDPVRHLGYYMNDDGETYDGDARTQHEKATVSMPIVMPLILKGMCDRNPFMRQHQVKDYLSGTFLRTGVIDFIEAKSNHDKENQYSTDDINNAFRNMRENGVSFTYPDELGDLRVHTISADKIREMLYKDDGDNVHGKLELMMTEKAFSYFNGLSVNSPVPSDRGVMKDLHRALASNARVSGWKPKHRIAFYHSTYDTVVPYDNLLSFISSQDDLNYFINKDKEHYFDGIIPMERIPVRNCPKPTHQVEDEDDADIYIYDTHTRKDHVGAGKDFYFMGTPSPDYKLMKWVIEDHTMSTTTADDLVTITLQNGDATVMAEGLRSGSSILLGNGQNACISQYTEGKITIPGTVNIGGQNYSVEVNQLAFRLCDKLTEVTIGEGVTWIGDFAFVGCSSLQKVSLPSTLNRIGGGAFVNLPKLTEMRCAASDAPAWQYNDLFAYEGHAGATSVLASQRALYVPRASANKYRKTKYGDVGWADAFGLISEATATTKTMEISTFQDLEDLATRVNGGDNMGDYTIRLTKDIIQEGDNRNQWDALTPIGTAEHPFSGVFDGQGHTIKNVRTYHDDNNNVDDNVGLFGYTDGAVISNLILQNISLRGRSNVGVVVGNANYSMIHDVLVYDAAATDGTKYYCTEATDGNAGGLVGKADETTIIDSYFYGKVKGTEAAGGIVGESASVNVSDCAAGHTVEGSNFAGGIVGKAGTATNVARCYSRSTLSATTVGGIIGQTQNDSESGISYCAYIDANNTMPVASGTIDGIAVTDNRLCATVTDMEGLKLQDLLGDEKWYYFHEDMSDCPVPASLADDYLVWAGMKDTNGYVFAPNDAEASSYSIVGYEGSAVELVLPDTYKGKPVTKVGDRAFKGSSITSITIPNSITAIGTEAFADCAELTTFSMGEGVGSDYNGWLKNCPKVSSIHVDDTNSAYYSPDGKALYDKLQTRFIRCSTTFEGILTMPSTVATIEVGAFAGCNDLTIVDLRETPTDYWKVTRSLPTSPFYNASKYTLFIMNQASYASNIATDEPNVVNLKTGYEDGGYECCGLYLTERLGINLGDNHFYFNAISPHCDRQFGPKLTYGKGEEYDYVYQPKAYALYLPYKLYLKAGQGARLYRYNDVITEGDVTTVLFKEVDKDASNYYSTSAGHPYYLVVESGDPFTLEAKASANVSEHGKGSGYENNGYAFVGNCIKRDNAQLCADANKPAYILQSDGNWQRVVQGKEDDCVDPFRAYFRASEATETTRLITMFDETLSLANDADNKKLIMGYNGSLVKSAELTGRILYKDGSWNTLCLPFSLSAEEVTAQLGSCTLKTLGSSEYDSTTGTLTLNFADATNIEAGKPYLIKWTKADGYVNDDEHNIVNPSFASATINHVDAAVETDYVTFQGSFSPISLAANDKTVLYLGADNKLYYPSTDMTVGSCRAVFALNGLTAGDLPNNARAFVLNFGDGDETTGIISIDNGQLIIDNSMDAWYTLDGRRLTGKPSRAGVYINNGKKIVIK